MHTTGSRRLFAVPLTVRLIAVLAIGLAATIAFLALSSGGAQGGPVFVVNTLSDAEDRDPGDFRCEIQPSTSGKCSLRAAIEESNALGGGVISFDPAIFPPGAPATIPINGPSVDAADPLGIGVLEQPLGGGRQGGQQQRGRQDPGGPGRTVPPVVAVSHHSLPRSPGAPSSPRPTRP